MTLNFPSEFLGALKGKTSDVIVGEGDWRMAWNAEVGGWKEAAFSLTTGLIAVWTRRRVGGWMWVMAMTPLPNYLLLW